MPSEKHRGWLLAPALNRGLESSLPILSAFFLSDSAYDYGLRMGMSMEHAGDLAIAVGIVTFCSLLYLVRWLAARYPHAASALDRVALVAVVLFLLGFGAYFFPRSLGTTEALGWTLLVLTIAFGIAAVLSRSRVIALSTLLPALLGVLSLTMLNHRILDYAALSCAIVAGCAIVRVWQETSVSAS